MNQEVRSTLEQLKHKLYPQTQPTEKQMNQTQPTPASIPTADLFKPMSVRKATAHCMSLKITKPAAIHKLTGKPLDQIYTALWAIRNKAKKAKAVVAKKEDKGIVVAKDWQTKMIADQHNMIVNLKAEIKDLQNKDPLPRNVTGEVQEVMEEVKQLRATVAYLESKLFGGK